MRGKTKAKYINMISKRNGLVKGENRNEKIQGDLVIFPIWFTWEKVDIQKIKDKFLNNV